MWLRLPILFAVVFAVTLQNAYVFSESVKMKMQNYGMNDFMDCMKEMNITKEKLDDYRQNKSMEELACLIDCYFKKEGVLDNDGMYVLEKGLKMTKAITEGKTDEEAKMLEDVATKCVSVNAVPVKDGKKGCERAFLIYECMHLNSDQVV